MSSETAGARGVLFVVSAPSGTGKTTVVERLVGEIPSLLRSRSYTSRPARPGETDGVDYNFISRPLFDAMIGRGEFLEWADVFGNLYGTARHDTETALAAGQDVVLVIDVQGARQVRARTSEAVSIFVLPPSFQALETRLRGRCQDDEAAITRRLDTARSEVSAVEAYEY
ncbi:MAG TPA: guanylate kinase, partial [Vicinamibacterales bacterium]